VAPGREATVDRSPNGGRPERIVLDNGLTVLVEERRGTRLAACLLLYRAGSLEEPEGKTGLAHLTEHMMFRGTPAYPEGRIDALTSSLGGVNNAMTTNDHALYYFVLPAEHWSTALAVEADRMVNCDLAPAQFEIERRIVLEERGMLDDDPDAALDEAVNALAFRRHPYGRPVAGLRVDIERLSLDDLRAFYETHYVPANAVLAVVGDVRVDDVASFVNAAFGALKAAPEGTPPDRSEPPQQSARRAEVVGNDRAARAVVAFRAPEALHPDSPALEVLGSVLSGGRSSRLHRDLVQTERVAAEASADRVLTVDPGLFTVSVLLRVGADPRRTEEAIVGLLEDVKRSGVGDQEIAKAKSLLALDYLMGVETSLGLAGYLAFWESLGGWELGPEFESRVSGVAGSDLARVLEAYFDEEAMCSAWRLARRS
jgi:zinc protease